jgi:K(+)-stimulated pyrophosphate-energized sodium pump
MAMLSVLTGFYILRFVKRQDAGTERMQFVSGAIKQGAQTFLNRMYRTLALFVVGMAAVLLIFLPHPIWATSNPLANVTLMAAYIFGSVCSALAGYLGMDVATDANVRSAAAARKGITQAFPIAFREIGRAHV